MRSEYSSVLFSRRGNFSFARKAWVSSKIMRFAKPDCHGNIPFKKSKLPLGNTQCVCMHWTNPIDVIWVVQAKPTHQALGI